MNWYRIDLHIHTPASADYQTPDVSLLDILRQAEVRGADIIAFTDFTTAQVDLLLRDVELEERVLGVADRRAFREDGEDVESERCGEFDAEQDEHLVEDAP